ncbi:MAG: CRISPR-associated helicase Cas3' [Candidatus Aenigmatarchaeota archaeon]
MTDLVDCCRELLNAYLEYQKKKYRRLSWQEEVWQEIVKHADRGGIGLLEAPTAAGKTEAAVMPYFAQHLMDKWSIAPAMIYVLPNKTLIRKQYDRLKELADVVILKKREKKTKIFIHHDIGGITYDKSFLIGDVIVTTLDCFIYGYLGLRSLGKRITIPAGLISTAYIVMDEIHLYQDEYYYTPQVLNIMLRQLKKLNVPLLLISATIPSSLKKKIFNSDELLDWNKKVKTCSRGRVKIEALEQTEIKKDFIEILELSLKNNSKVLIIVNTVKRAVEVFESLKKFYGSSSGTEIKIELIHSRLVEKTRIERENSLSSAHIVVATQVAESGLDMENVQLLISEEAPPDVLIQRLGRCARREYETGTAYIIKARSDTPYPPILLERVEDLHSRKKAFEEALFMLDKARDLIDSRYDKWEPKVSKKLEDDLENLVKYIEGQLGLVRVPKHQYVRPNLYITLALLEKEVKPNDHIKTEELIEKTFNVEWRGKEARNYAFLKRLEDKRVLELEWDPEESMYLVRSVDRIHPLSIYVLDPDYYEKYKDGYELGLVKLGETD